MSGTSTDQDTDQETTDEQDELVTDGVRELGELAHCIEITMSYGAASVLSRAPVHLHMTLATGQDTPASAERFEFYDAFRSGLRELVQAVTEQGTEVRTLREQLERQRRDTKLANTDARELRGYLTRMLDVLADFGYQPDSDTDPATWTREALDHAATKIDQVLDTGLTEAAQHINNLSATLVEVHANWHEAAELVGQGDDPHEGGAMGLHGRMHEALGLAQTHPWPDPFELGKDVPLWPMPAVDDDAGSNHGPHIDTAPIGQPVDTEPEGQPVPDADTTTPMPANDSDGGQGEATQRKRRGKAGGDG